MSTGKRPLVRGAVLVALPMLALAIGAGVSNASVTAKVDTGGTALNERQGPTAASTAEGSLADGASVTISCQTYGQDVAGHLGTSQVWDELSNGEFVSDTYIYTGSDGLVASLCAGSDAEAAAKWAAAEVGSSTDEDECELFVEQAYGTSARYGTATADYDAQKAAGRIHTTGAPPPGALLFFTSTTAAGHVMLSLGGGWAASTAPSSPIYYAHGTARSDYLGWSYAPTSWPGR